MSNGNATHRKVKARRLAVAISMGYDARHVPMCKNCQHMTKVEGKGTPFCTKGQFNVMLYAVCDQWQGMDGSMLELD
jgi:hypothetical protein